MARIDLDNITKRYPDGTVAVDDLNLDVPDGSLTVFVGPSGCGKTTSMRMINRMVDPSSGSVIVDGRDVRGVDPVKLRLGIGYVIQSGQTTTLRASGTITSTSPGGATMAAPAANAFTTRTPDTFSSTSAVSSAIRCWTSVRAGREIRP